MLGAAGWLGRHGEAPQWHAAAWWPGAGVGLLRFFLSATSIGTSRRYVRSREVAFSFHTDSFSTSGPTRRLTANRAVVRVGLTVSNVVVVVAGTDGLFSNVLKEQLEP